ncbi:hypothetical protein VPH35_129636 [Triticum aestivum]
MCVPHLHLQLERDGLAKYLRQPLAASSFPFPLSNLHRRRRPCLLSVSHAAAPTKSVPLVLRFRGHLMVFIDGWRGRAAAPGGMPRRAAWQPLPHALLAPSHRLHRHAHLCQDRASMPPIYRAGVAASWLRHRAASNVLGCCRCCWPG